MARKSGSATTPEAKQLQGDEKDAAENVQTEKKNNKNKQFLKRFKPGFYGFTDRLVLMMKGPVSVYFAPPPSLSSEFLS